MLNFIKKVNFILNNIVIFCSNVLVFPSFLIFLNGKWFFHNMMIFISKMSLNWNNMEPFSGVLQNRSFQKFQKIHRKIPVLNSLSIKFQVCSKEHFFTEWIWVTSWNNQTNQTIFCGGVCLEEGSTPYTAGL